MKITFDGSKMFVLERNDDGTSFIHICENEGLHPGQIKTIPKEERNSNSIVTIELPKITYVSMCTAFVSMMDRSELMKLLRSELTWSPFRLHKSKRRKQGEKD